jgi:hypothetical protein
MEVKRDSFARGYYERESHGKGTCEWCGQERRVVFSYTWQEDSVHRRNKPSYLERTFCNFNCFSIYNL